MCLFYYNFHTKNRNRRWFENKTNHAVTLKCAFVYFYTLQHNFLMCLHFTMIVILIWLEGLLWSWSCVRGFDINGCPIARGKWKWHPTCPIRSVKMILWYVQFLKSKMINIELFSVGSRSKFYLNIASYVSCILLHFVLFFWPEFPFLK